LDTGEKVFSNVTNLYHLSDEMKSIWPLAVNCKLDQSQLLPENTAFAATLLRDMCHEVTAIESGDLRRNRIGLSSNCYISFHKDKLPKLLCP